MENDCKINVGKRELNFNWLKYGVSRAFVQQIERMKSRENCAVGEKYGRSCCT